jgi:hypothetical protein
MLRRALSYQLILAVAVGPMLCCCSAGKSLAGSPSTPPASTSAPAHAPAARVLHSCCSHKQHTPAKSDSGQKPAPAKPGQPTGKCPCKDGAGKPQVAPTELTQTDLATFLRSLTFDTFVSLVFPAAETVSAPARLGGGECLNSALSPTDELLHAHHNLRC